VRLLAGKRVRGRLRFKRAGRETKGPKSLAERRLSGRAPLTGVALARAPALIEAVL
jgi:hypothetical protein